MTIALTVHPNGDYDIHHIQTQFITLVHLHRILPKPPESSEELMFEELGCGPHAVMLVDQEGLWKGLPTNDHAGRIMERIALRSVRIVGSVILVGRANGDGDTTGLTPDVVSDFIDLIHP